MARVIEQVIAVKLSRIVKDNDSRESVLSDEQTLTMLSSIPELAESVIDDASVVVEVMELK
jgi:hypothetical protein